MKTLFLIRHAKSSWTNINQKDFDRPLDKSGIESATEMAIRLRKHLPKIDLFIASPAVRTTETCKIFCAAFQYHEKDIAFAPDIYEGAEKNYESVVIDIAQEHSQVAIVGHNPGITYFANRLVEDIWIDSMPPCAMVAVESTCTEWKDFIASAKRCLFYECPENNAD